MDTFEFVNLVASLPKLEISPNMTEESAMESMRFFSSFNHCTIGVVHFSGKTPWERHSDGDELLQVVSGTIEVTTVTNEGESKTSLRQGSILVVPKGLWHRQYSADGARLLFATPAEGNESSWAENPTL